MAKFMIRVELHDATPEDYDNFHDAMENRNMLKRIQDEETLRWYNLPRAQYHYKGEIKDREIISSNVTHAVNETGVRIFELVITASSGSTWEGLSEYFF